MPLPVLDDGERDAALAAADPALVGLLEEHDIPAETQAVLYHFGYTKVRTFAKIDRDEAGFRDFVRDQLGLNPTAGLAVRAQVADLVCAWEMTREHATKENEARAERKAHGLPEPMVNTDFRAMKKAFQSAYFELPKLHVPGKMVVAAKLTELEENELKVEKLTAVYC